MPGLLRRQWIISGNSTHRPGSGLRFIPGQSVVGCGCSGSGLENLQYDTLRWALSTVVPSCCPGLSSDMSYSSLRLYWDAGRETVCGCTYKTCPILLICSHFLLVFHFQNENNGWMDKYFLVCCDKGLVCVYEASCMIASQASTFWQKNYF